MKVYVEKIERETGEFLAHWGKEGEIDLFHVLSELTILTASRTLHDADVREELFREVSELYHDMDTGLTPLTVFSSRHIVFAVLPVKMVELQSKINVINLMGNILIAQILIFMNIKCKDGTTSITHHWCDMGTYNFEVLDEAKIDGI